MKRPLLLAGWAAVLGGCVSRPPPTPPTPAPYVRLIEQPPDVWRLECAARRFTPARGGGPDIWLTGVSHLGEPAYYRALQAHLDARTQVWFEGVGGEDQPRGPATATEKEPTADTLQSRLAAALGLAFQLEAIDYERPHFHNSDLSISELRDLLAQPHETSSGAPAPGAAWQFDQMIQLMEGESVFSQLLNLGLRWLGTQPRYQALSRFTLMETINQLQGDFDSLGALPASMRDLLQVLVAERNRKVMADLTRALPTLHRGDSISLFYGAGHMRDLEIRLRTELNYVPREDLWFEVMTVDARAAGLSRADMEATRETIRRQMQTLRGPAPAQP